MHAANLKIRSCLIVAGLVLGAAIIAAPPPVPPTAPPEVTARTEPGKDKDGAPARAEAMVEVHFQGSGNLTVRLLDEALTLTTPYGKLRIPVKEIDHIEFATRLADTLEKPVESALQDLDAAEYRKRETATDALKKIGWPAHFRLKQALKTASPEAAQRLEELIQRIEENTPAERLVYREHDVITTSHSKIAGKIEASSIRIQTAQFGEQSAKLHDITMLHIPGYQVGGVKEDTSASDAPNSMAGQSEIGKKLRFRVTGANPANPSGTVWGTDVYTADSNLGLAAVHMGLVKPGESRVLTITILPGQPLYNGSTRHGVTSANYINYPISYKISR